MDASQTCYMNSKLSRIVEAGFGSPGPFHLLGSSHGLADSHPPACRHGARARPRGEQTWGPPRDRRLSLGSSIV